MPRFLIALVWMILVSCALLAGSAIAAPPKPVAKPMDNGKGVKLGKESVQKIQVGVRVSAQGGPCSDLFCTVPVPMEWPEQQVRKLEEDVTPNVRFLDYREQPGVRQMIVRIPLLPAGEEARALITFEVVKRDMAAPADTSIFSLPKQIGRPLAPYVVPSPFIESRADKIVKLSKEITSQKSSAWEKVEAIYDWVREHVKYQEGPLKGAIAALRDGTGDCEELSSLFIAMCRASNIPARTIWVQGHCYPEFYLVDDEGQGHWFPCQAAGDKMFGAMTEARPILQKGDNFTVPEQRQKLRYVSEFVTGSGAGGKPSVQFFRREVKD